MPTGSRSRSHSHSGRVPLQFVALASVIDGTGGRTLDQIRGVLADALRDAEALERLIVAPKNAGDVNFAAGLIADRLERGKVDPSDGDHDSDAYGLSLEAAEQGIWLGMALAFRHLGAVTR